MSIDLHTVVLACAALLLLAILYFVIKSGKKQTADSVISMVLADYQRDELKNFIIPDGIGGLIEIEHLVLMDQGLLLIERYPISGNLFAADKIDLWTQILDGRSYKFANPLRHIRTSKQAVKLIAPDVPIFCRVIFTADSIFPKDKPEEVSVLSSLDIDLLFLKEQANVSVKAKNNWEQLKHVARFDEQAVMRGEGIEN